MSIETAAAVAAHYDLGRPQAAPNCVARGELGRLWRLTTERGRFAVKESLMPVAEPDAAADVAFQFAAAAAGVRLPRPVLGRDGRVLLPGAEAASAAPALRVYEWVDLAEQPLSGSAVGEVAAALHRLGYPANGPMADWFAEPAGALVWYALLGTAEAAGAPWADELRRWLPELIALDEAVRQPDPSRLCTCHLDLNLHHVRRSAAGSVVVLDWENCGPAQPERELAMLLAALAADASIAVAIEAYQAYRAAGGPAELTGPDDFSTAIAVQGHLFAFYAWRTVDPTCPAQVRAKAHQRVRRMLARPLTRGYVTELLRALNTAGTGRPR